MGLKQRSWDLLEEMGEQIRKNIPSLTKEQAIVKAMQTPEGKELYEVYSAAGDEVVITKSQKKTCPHCGGDISLA